MPFNPENPSSIKRLRQSTEWSEKRLRSFREQKQDALRQYVGKRYGDNGAKDRVPLNTIQLGVSVYRRQIVPVCPQALVTTPYEQLAAGAEDLRLAVNYVAKQIDVLAALRETAMEAMFGMGVIKMGQDENGELFVDPVLFEDFIFDMGARRWAEASFMGNRYRVPLEEARENPNYDRQARSKLKSTEKSGGGIERGDSSIRSENLSQGDGIMQDRLEDQVELIDYWLPRERLLITLDDADCEYPLNIVDWDGPKNGPFHHWGFEDVPGNILPLAPVQMWMDLHELINRLFLKAGRQAERQKTVMGVMGHAKDDAARIIDAVDGEAIYTENPEGSREFKFGGADPTNLAMILQSKQLSNYYMGNVDAIAGLAAQTQTVGQDKLLNESASGRIKDMQETAMTFNKGIFEDMAYVLWNDPLIDLPLVKRLPGTDVSIQFNFTPERKMGEFFHYNFDVDPYSMQSRSPAERINQITQFVIQVLPVATQILGPLGTLDKFLDLYAKYMDLPELRSLGGTGMPQGEPIMPGMATSTTRTHVRKNIPAASQQGHEQTMAALLMGGNPQPAEMAGLMRPAS